MFSGSYWGRNIRAFSHSIYVYRKALDINEMI